MTRNSRAAIQRIPVKVEGAGWRRPQPGHLRVSTATSRPQRRQGERVITVAPIHSCTPHVNSTPASRTTLRTGQAYLATPYTSIAPAGRLVIHAGRLHPDLDCFLAAQGCRAWAYYGLQSRLRPVGRGRQPCRQRCLEEEIIRGGWSSAPARESVRLETRRRREKRTDLDISRLLRTRSSWRSVMGKRPCSSASRASLPSLCGPPTRPGDRMLR